ncbi:MAG TPA: hypothetical protein VHW44_09350 [Pseudonocardiaceae bacterium]|nr:hypothetical protein [Pseudonocardiaceae bacterium]
MRWLVLYSRSRQVGLAIAAVLAGTVVMSLLSRTAGDTASGRWAVLAVGLGAAAAGSGLGGVDPALERTAAIRWPVRRAVHVVVVAIVVGVVPLAAGLGPGSLILRDALGLSGLTALTATLAGAQLAWTLPVIWAVATVAFPITPTSPVLLVLTWPAGQAAGPAATLAAAVLAVGGTLTYAVVGCRR